MNTGRKIGRTHCLQLCWRLRDPTMKEKLRERPLFQLPWWTGSLRLPSESSILRSRHLLENCQLAPQVLATFSAGPAHQGLFLKTSTVVDATCCNKDCP